MKIKFLCSRPGCGIVAERYECQIRDLEQVYCSRECYRQVSKEKRLDQNRKQIVRSKSREFVDRLKADPCTDCGRSFLPCQMQFDHMGSDKIANISKLAKSGSIESIKLEIEKCELVCANCHCLRTFNRRSNYSVVM